MINLGGRWYRGALASLVLAVWTVQAPPSEAQTLRPNQPGQQTRPTANNSAANRTVTNSGNFASPYVVNNNAGLGTLGGGFNVPNYSRTSYLVPGVGSVTAGYNPNYPGYNLFVPYSGFNPYTAPYSPYGFSPNQFSPYPYSPYSHSPYSYSPYSYSPYSYSPYSYSPYSYSSYQAPYMGLYSANYNQFNPCGLYQTGNVYGSRPYDPFGNAFGGGMGYGSLPPY
jgi:hypothetical protein